MGFLSSAIKALFTKNTTNAASVSGARVPIVAADGTPIGNDSMANLASVLGVGTLKTTTINNADWNNYKGCQIVISSTSVGFDWQGAHRPTGNDATLVCLGSETRLVQFHIDQIRGVWIRSKGDRNPDYSAWENIIEL